MGLYWNVLITSPKSQSQQRNSLALSLSGSCQLQPEEQACGSETSPPAAISVVQGLGGGGSFLHLEWLSGSPVGVHEGRAQRCHCGNLDEQFWGRWLWGKFPRVDCVLCENGWNVSMRYRGAVFSLV